MSRHGNLHRRKLLRQSIQDQVEHYIIDHGYKTGDVLPAEAVLASELGISRPSLREAIRVLQTLGVVESRHGTGTFVGEFSLAPLVDGLAFNILIQDDESTVRIIRELLKVREILEKELVSAAAVELTAEVIDELDEIVDRMELRAINKQEFSREDREFHDLLYRRLGNPLVVQLIQAFWDVFDRLRESLPDVIGDLGDIVANHQLIVDCLRRRDGQAAADAMSDHFDGIRNRVYD